MCIYVCSCDEMESVFLYNWHIWKTKHQEIITSTKQKFQFKEKKYLLFNIFDWLQNFIEHVESFNSIAPLESYSTSLQYFMK